MHRFLFAAPLLLIGAASLAADTGPRAEQAAMDQEKLAKALAGLTPGKPQSCINQRSIDSTRTIGDTILYKVSRREIYRADTSGGCFGLRRGDAIVSRTPSSQLCSGDILRTVDFPSGIESGSCSIEAFVPYR